MTTAPATDVRQAYFDHLWRHDDDVWSHPTPYVDRRAGAHRSVHLRLRDELLEAKGDFKRLFTGQVGTGKSTELHQLVTTEELRKRFEVVPVQADEQLNLARFVDIRYLLVALGSALARTLEGRAGSGNLGFAVGRWRTLAEWTRILAADPELPDPSQISGRELAGAVARKLNLIEVSLKTDDGLRDALRTTEVSQVRDLVVGLAEELATASGREILVVVDDLDKVRDRDTVVHLFRDHLMTLRGLQPLKWLMTMPYGLRFDPTLQVPQGLVSTLPNVKVVARSHPTVLVDDGRRFFRTLLAGLVDPSLVADDVVDRATLLSAGIPREFLRIVHRAFGVAHYASARQVQSEHLGAAEIELRSELQPLHADSQVKRWLELVRVRPDELSPAQRELMANLLVVERSNDEQWYDVHPLLAADYDARLAHRAARLRVEPSDREALAADLTRQIGG